MLTGSQIREARTLLGWQREDLASRTAQSLSVVARAEVSDGDPYLSKAQDIVIKHVFETAGIEFTAKGVKLRKVEL